MLQDVLHWCTYISQTGLILLALLWLLRYRQLPTLQKRLGVFIFLSIAVQFYAVYLSRQKLPNLYVLHIYTLLEFWAWSFFYSYLLKDQARFQKTLPWIIGIASSFIILNSIYFEPLTGFNSNAKSLVQLLLIAASIYYFFLIFGKIDLNKERAQSLLLLNFAVLLYYSGSLFIFMFSKLLISTGVADIQQMVFWVINGMIYIVFVVLLLYSLWKAAFSRTNS